MRSQPLGDQFYAEGSAWPEIADALVERAATMEDPKEGARTLGWATRGCMFLPTDLVRPDLSASLGHTRKEPFADAMAKHIELFRAWLTDRAPERRTAGAHALAWCVGVSAADARAALDQASRESNAAALATELLTLGVVLHRIGGGADPELTRAARELGAAKLSDKGALVRLCAATMLAFCDRSLARDAMTVVAEHVVKPSPLPAEWGWTMLLPPAMRSDSIACAVCCWVGTDAPEVAVHALAVKDLEGERPGFVNQVGEALVHMAFEVRGRAVPELGLVASELDGIEREAVGAFARDPLRRAQPALGKLALPVGADLGHFLPGDTLEWRPIPIEVDGQQRLWHFGRIWGEVVFGHVGIEDARNAIARALAPRDAVTLVTVFTRGRMPAYERIRDEAPWQRDQELALAVVGDAVERGFAIEDVIAIAREPGGLPAIATVAYLRFHRGAPRPDDHRVFVDGIEQAKCVEPLRSLVAALPPDTRCALLDAARVYPVSFALFDLCLDETNVRKLIGSGAASGADTRRRVVELLADAGDEHTIGILESLQFPNERQATAAAPVIAAALEALRARRPGG